MTNQTLHSKKTIEISAWLAYSIILFEMLYMSTPFAAFFYSVYKSPLMWLAGSEKTAWLAHAIMPHFSESGSVLVNVLLLVSWPLMVTGLVIFMIGFGQIYYAKFKGKGAVTGGIYSYIRHPQYAAWIIFGLGMCLFWSRMIVWITYVMMIFIYLYLAHAEEQECLSKFGDSYREYLGKTGGFFPRIIKSHGLIGQHDHAMSRAGRMVMITMVFLVTECLVIGAGVWLRHHADQHVYGTFEQNRAAVALVRMPENTINQLLSIAENDELTKDKVISYTHAQSRQLVYIMPYGWNISELLDDSDHRNTFHDTQLFVNPSGHGNSVSKNNTTYRLLFSEPVCPESAQGRDIITRATRQIPKLLVDVDLESGRVLSVQTPPSRGRYGDIPVPLY